MSKRIHKWTLAVTDRQTLALPAHAQLLTIQLQHEHPQLWALVDTGAPFEDRTIAIYGTGNPLPDKPGEYIATFQMDGGALVWHGFEVPA